MGLFADRIKEKTKNLYFRNGFVISATVIYYPMRIIGLICCPCSPPKVTPMGKTGEWAVLDGPCDRCENRVTHRDQCPITKKDAEIVRLREVEKAADKMAEALEQLNMECRMADNRGELAGEVDGGTMDNAESALKAYEKSKAQGKGVV